MKWKREWDYAREKSQEFGGVYTTYVTNGVFSIAQIRCGKMNGKVYVVAKNVDGKPPWKDFGNIPWIDEEDRLFVGKTLKEAKDWVASTIVNPAPVGCPESCNVADCGEGCMIADPEHTLHLCPNQHYW